MSSPSSRITSRAGEDSPLLGGRQGQPSSPWSNIVLMTAVLILLTFSLYHLGSRFVLAQAIAQVLVYGYFLLVGVYHPQVWTPGWGLIVAGLNLVVFGAFVDIAPHVSFLRSQLTTDEPYRTLLRQVVGYNTGLVLIAFGFYRWVPSFLASRRVLEDLVERYEDRIIHNEKLNALAGLASGIAHDLANPLSVIRGYAHLLTRGPRPEMLTKAAGEIDQAVAVCVRVADNLRAFARQPLGEVQVMDVRDALRTALDLLRYDLALDRIEVREDLTGEMPPVRIQRQQVVQAFLNLLQNAQLALRDHDGPRRIELACRLENGLIAVDIADTGPGVPPDLVGKVFEPFFTSRAASGAAGLGLTIASGVLKAHGGWIDLRSEPRVRTVVRCLIPVEPVEGPPMDPGPVRPGPSGPTA